MKGVMLILLCTVSSVHCNNEKRVRVMQGSCKGNEGVIAWKMHINLHIATTDMVNMLLSGYPKVTDQQKSELIDVIEAFKKTPTVQKPSVSCVQNEQFSGVFDSQSLEEIS